jgi:hypothetical protein
MLAADSPHETDAQHSTIDACTLQDLSTSHVLSPIASKHTHPPCTPSLTDRDESQLAKAESITDFAANGTNT